MENDRRQFLRIRVPAEAEALDEQGKKLGTVEEAGGGGMRICLQDGAPAPAVGSHVTLTVVEPGTNHVVHTTRVLVRYLEDGTLGVEFTGEGGPSQG